MYRPIVETFIRCDDAEWLFPVEHRSLRSSELLARSTDGFTAGVPVELEFYPRTNHYTMIGVLARPLRLQAPVLDDVVAFVRGAPAR